MSTRDARWTTSFHARLLPFPRWTEFIAAVFLRSFFFPDTSPSQSRDFLSFAPRIPDCDQAAGRGYTDQMIANLALCHRAVQQPAGSLLNFRSGDFPSDGHMPSITKICGKPECYEALKVQDSNWEVGERAAFAPRFRSNASAGTRFSCGQHGPPKVRYAKICAAPTRSATSQTTSWSPKKVQVE